MVSTVFLIAIVLVFLSLPVFSQIAERNIPSLRCLIHGSFCPFIGLLMLVSFLSGMYPALFLSGFNTIESAEGKVLLQPRVQSIPEGPDGISIRDRHFLLILHCFCQTNGPHENSRLNATGDQLLSIRHGGTADYTGTRLSKTW